MLEEILGLNLEQTIDFYVYNTETDTVRTATLMPNLKWGGRGCLGAEVSVCVCVGGYPLPLLHLTPAFPILILILSRLPLQKIGHGYLHGLPQKCCRSNGTSVFKAPAPHIADATRAMIIGNGGGVGVGGWMEKEAGRRAEEGQEVNVVDVNLQKELQEQEQERELEAEQEPPLPAVRQEG